MPRPVPSAVLLCAAAVLPARLGAQGPPEARRIVLAGRIDPAAIPARPTAPMMAALAVPPRLSEAQYRGLRPALAKVLGVEERALAGQAIASNNLVGMGNVLHVVPGKEALPQGLTWDSLLMSGTPGSFWWQAAPGQYAGRFALSAEKIPAGTYLFTFHMDDTTDALLYTVRDNQSPQPTASGAVQVVGRMAQVVWVKPGAGVLTVELVFPAIGRPFKLRACEVMRIR